MATKTEIVEWAGFAGIIVRVTAPADAQPYEVADLCRDEMVSRIVKGEIAAHDIGVGEMFVIPEGGE
jgi:hypothetical protein